MHYNFEYIAVFVVLCVGVGIRGIVSLSLYSGASTPPMFGDYEAQRHWQEVTYNLPAYQWYLNTTENDLLYWGLDYPPLTAYHSYILGIIANRLNSSYVKLFDSRGLESVEHKSFMRLTVLMSDLFVYIPAIAIVTLSLEPISSKVIIPFLMLLVFYPCQILIDNGHFQYNNISLGLFLFSVANLLQNRHCVSSFTFSMALNYKQMELYHALPIFTYLLKASFLDKSILKNMLKLLKIAFCTVTTFVLLWMPWISSIDTFITAVVRLFPLNRGVFEDKVANVWCSLNVIYKFKENLQNGKMALICLVSTFVATAPANLHLFFDFKKKTLLYTLTNTSLSFFLFSFQVHEKSILLAAIPMCLIFNMMPFSVICFLKISTFSILPLLIKDNLSINYFCLVISYCILYKYLVQLVYSKDNETQNNLTCFMDLLDMIILITSIATLLIPPPEKLPYLWPVVISVYCCLFFIVLLFELNLQQYNNFFSSFKYLKTLSMKYIY